LIALELAIFQQSVGWHHREGHLANDKKLNAIFHNANNLRHNIYALFERASEYLWP
jgi:hypothetical protein